MPFRRSCSWAFAEDLEWLNSFWQKTTKCRNRRLSVVGQAGKFNRGPAIWIVTFEKLPPHALT